MRRRILTTLIFLFLGLSSFSQGWQKSYTPPCPNGPCASEIIDIQPTLDGGYIAIENVSSPNPTLPNTVDTIVMLLKVDAVGNELWHKKIFPNATSKQVAYSITTTPDSGFLAHISEFPIFTKSFLVVKLDSQGDTLWTRNQGGACCGNSFKNNSTVTTDGNYLVSNINENKIEKITPQGSPIWTSNALSNYYHVKAISNNRTAVVTPVGLALFDGQGSMLWQSAITAPAWYNRQYIVEPLSNGNLIVIGQLGEGVENLSMFNDSGTKLWQKDLPTNYGALEDVSLMGNGNFILAHRKGNQLLATEIDTLGTIVNSSILAGSIFLSDDGVNSICLNSSGANVAAGGYFGKSTIWEIGANGTIYTNQINGTLYIDANTNCLEDAGEVPLRQWVVEVQQNNNSFYALSDTNGYYAINVDLGSSTVLIHPPFTNNYWNYCQNNVASNFSLPNDTATIDFGVQAMVNCPQMVVDIGTPLLRMCCPTDYTVNYCNLGTASTPNAYVEIDFDNDLIITGSSIPWSSQNGNTYTFPVGMMNIGDCSQFTVTTILDTSTVTFGATHCTEAHIYPDTICNPSMNWNGAEVAVSGQCLTDSVEFTIQNIGTANMSQSKTYFVIEDHVIMRTASFQLNQGGSLIVKVPTSGGTFRLVAEQEDNHPYSQYPTAAVEGCTNLGTFSIGFVNIFSNDDAAPYLSIDCTPNIGSFDPNDKQATPQGWNEEHFILPNMAIDYKIRFQNTGTDTAFTVVIRDTIDTDKLDLTTLQLGASSHNYQATIEGQNVLVFTFNNIMLPDSNTNELASHGFMQFNIQQQTNNPLGSLIENNAAIYFDSNAPVITNTAFHTIGVLPFSVQTEKTLLSPETTLNVYPNPFLQKATFELNDKTPRNLDFTVFDSMGRIVYQEYFSNTYQFDFYRNGLASGFYFFNIIENGQIIGKGKIIVR